MKFSSEVPVQKKSEAEKNEGWEKVTETYRSSLAKFAREKLFGHPGTRSKYDNSTGAHLSGGSSNSTKAWAEGDAAAITEINILVENGKPTQLHGYARRGEGQGTDIYLTKSALQDFLESSKTS